MDPPERDLKAQGCDQNSAPALQWGMYIDVPGTTLPQSNKGKTSCQVHTRNSQQPLLP